MDIQSIHCDLARKCSIHSPQLEDPYTIHMYSRYGLWDLIRILATQYPEKLQLWGVSGHHHFEKCCQSGNVEVAKWLLSIKPPCVSIYTDYFPAAIKSGNVEMIEWIHSWISERDMDYIKSRMSYHLASDAVKSGSLDMVRWFFDSFETNSIHQNTAFSNACISGHLHIAKWLYATYPTITVDYNANHGIHEACRLGFVDVVEWLFSIHPGFNTQEMKNCLLYAACGLPVLEMVQFLISIGAKIEYLKTDNAFHHACRVGSPRIIRWICEQYPQRYRYFYHYQTGTYTPNIQYSFVEECQKILKGLISHHINNKSTYLAYYLSNAAKHGFTGILEHYQALYPRTFAGDSSKMIYEAAKHGHIDVIHYVYSITENVDLSAYNHGGFITACEAGYIQVAEWYRSIKPEKYNFRMDNDVIIPIIRKDYPIREVKVCDRTSCAICWEDQSDLITRCGHQYCQSCIEEWMNTSPSCPYCRNSLEGNLPEPPLFYIQNMTTPATRC